MSTEQDLEHSLVTGDEAAALAAAVVAVQNVIRLKAPHVADAIDCGQVQATISLAIPVGHALVRIREAGQMEFKELFRVRMGDDGRAN